MGAGDDHQRPVVRVDLLEHEAEGQHVVIGVRIERPVLMPLHRRPASWRLGVQLAGLQHRVRPQQVGRNLGDPGVSQKFPKERMLSMRQLDPRQARVLGAVALVEVVEVVALGHAARLVDEIYLMRRSVSNCAELTAFSISK